MTRMFCHGGGGGNSADIYIVIHGQSLRCHRINLNVAIAGVMFAQIPQPPQYADAPDAKIPYELPVQAGVGRRVRRAKQDNIQLRGNKGQLVIDFARIPQEVNHMAAGEGKAQV